MDFISYALMFTGSLLILAEGFNVFLDWRQRIISRKNFEKLKEVHRKISEASKEDYETLRQILSNISVDLVNNNPELEDTLRAVNTLHFKYYPPKPEEAKGN